MDKDLYLNKHNLKKWIKENFNSKFINTPTFSLTEVKGVSLVQKFYVVSTYQFTSIENFKKFFLERRNGNFFIFEQEGEILQQFNGESVFRIRMAINEKNRRYKIKTKSYE